MDDLGVESAPSEPLRPIVHASLGPTGNGLSSLQPRKAAMATSAERQNMIRRARELANSGQLFGWVSIENSMKATHELSERLNLLDDFDLRRELDARCAAARRDKAARTG
jgi:hypothetical protein